jgi:hypothetical protein
LKLVQGGAEITGTPRAWGTYSFSVSATDTANYVGTQTFRVTIGPAVTFSPAPATARRTLDGGTSTQTDTALPNAVAGQPYSQTISVASDNGISSLTTDTQSWNGLSFNVSGSTVTVSGTPTQFTNPTLGGALSPLELKVTATDGNQFTDVTTYQINVEPAPSSSPYVAIRASFDGSTHDDLPTVIAGQAFSATFVTPPDAGTFQLTLANGSAITKDGTGSLPPGMTFDAASATLSGTPTVPGDYNLVVQAANATSGVVDSRVFQLTVNPDPSGLGITPVALPLAVYGTPYLERITISGAKSYIWSVSGSLADFGLSIAKAVDDDFSLILSGTPTVDSAVWADSPVLTIKATDSSGTELTQTYTITPAYTPAQIRHAYSLDQVILSGGIIGDGTGQTVAIIDGGDAANLVSSDDPNYANSDLHRFNQQFGLPDSPFLKADAFGGSNIPTEAGDVAETTMDVEWVHAIAPGARIIVLEYSKGAEPIDVYTAIQTARGLPGVSVVSMSLAFFDDNNANNNDNYVETNIDPLFTSPTGHPMTFLAGAGDGNSGPLAVYPAISSNVVAVGYSELTLNAQGGYGSESAVAGAGGGPSLQELQPSWQQGVASQSSGTMRSVPDVTFNGGGKTAVAVYNSFTHGEGLPWSRGAGTSVATPCWAGLMAIADEGRARIGHAPLDGPTQTLPELYALAGTSDFNEVLTVAAPAKGGTPTSISPLFGAYNPWAGLGSPVANLLAADLIGGKRTISGTVFLNADGSGVPDSTNPGLPGLTVFLDANGNGRLDPGEAATTTGPDGAYEFLVAPGDYAVGVVLSPGWTRPTSSSTTVALTPGATTDPTVNIGLDGPVAPPPTAPPTVLDIRRQIVGKGRRRKVELQIVFNTALDPGPARRLHNYRLTRPDPSRRSRPHAIEIRSVRYDPATDSVTLSLVPRVAPGHMLLSIHGLMAAGTPMTSISTPV